MLLGREGADRVDARAGNDRIAVEYDGAIDDVSCGPGRDIVTADLRDRVRVGCEIVGRRIHRDRFANPESQHESQVEPDSLTVGATTVTLFQVGRNRSGGAASIGFATSRDAGRTWREGILPGLTAGLTAGRDVRPRQRSRARLRRGARRLAREHARTGAGGDAADDPPLDERARVDWADRRHRRTVGGSRLRQELDHLRQRRGKPVPRPLLPRVHAARPERPGRGAAFRRRRANLVGAGDAAADGDRRASHRPAGRPARAHVLVRPHGDGLGRVGGRRRHARSGRDDLAADDAQRSAVPLAAADRRRSSNKAARC